MFDRLVTLIGKENLDLIKSKRILVIGVGGVGGYVLEGLVRSGVEMITIVDKDTIEETNLNRQIIALQSTLGKSKVEIMKERLEDINPQAKVEALKFFLKETLEGLDFTKYDYVVDCIDDVKVKVSLAKYALEKKLNFIMATGTAKKIDPSMLTMTTLDKTSYDPLAKKMRTLLRGYDMRKIVVLSSKEEPIQTSDGTLGSTAFVPSVGGLLIASYIIRDIIKDN